MNDKSKGPHESIEISHISGHFINGAKDTHAISQRITADSQSMTAYTNVGGDGNVGQSGFGPTTGSKK